MRRRWARWVLVFGGGGLLAAVGMILLVPRLVPADLLTARIVAGMEEATGATVSLEETRLHWAWGWRLTLKQGRIHGTGEALAAASGSHDGLKFYAVDFEELTIVPALAPLLEKRLVVRSVGLTGSRLEVAWRTGGFRAQGFGLRIEDLQLGPGPFPGVVPASAGPGSVAPGPRIPAALAFGFAARADSLVIEGVPCDDVHLEGRFAKRLLAVSEVAAGCAGGTLGGEFSLDFADNPWGHLEFSAVVRGAPALVLLDPWTPDIARKLDCPLDADVAGGFDIRDQGTLERTVDVAGRLRGGPGVLHAAEWLHEVRPYLKDRQDLVDVRFTDLDHRFRYRQGRYFLESLVLAGGDTDWSGMGWLDPEGDLAVGLEVRFPRGFTPDLGNFSVLAALLRDEDGRIRLPLTMSGPTRRPNFGVDLGRLRGR